MKPFFKREGIPLKEAGSRLIELEKALEEHAMAIGAELDYHVDFVGENERVRSATLTVYFFEKEEDKTPENLGNSKAVKNLEE